MKRWIHVSLSASKFIKASEANKASKVVKQFIRKYPKAFEVLGK